MRFYLLFVNYFRSSIIGITSLNADDKTTYFTMVNILHIGALHNKYLVNWFVPGNWVFSQLTCGLSGEGSVVVNPNDDVTAYTYPLELVCSVWTNTYMIDSCINQRWSSEHLLNIFSFCNNHTHISSGWPWFSNGKPLLWDSNPIIHKI